MTTGGAFLRSKPVTKSAMIWLGIGPSATFALPLAAACSLACCARLMPGSPSSVTVLAPRKILRSSEFLPSSFAMAVSPADVNWRRFRISVAARVQPCQRR